MSKHYPTPPSTHIEGQYDVFPLDRRAHLGLAVAAARVRRTAVQLHAQRHVAVEEIGVINGLIQAATEVDQHFCQSEKIR